MSYKLEKWVQEVIVKKYNKDVTVITGTVAYNSEDLKRIGADNNILVQDMCYKILIEKNKLGKMRVFPFLFPDGRGSEYHNKPIMSYLVPMDYFELITGLNLDTDLNIDKPYFFERSIDYEFLAKYEI